MLASQTQLKIHIYKIYKSRYITNRLEFFLQKYILVISDDDEVIADIQY